MPNPWIDHRNTLSSYMQSYIDSRTDDVVQSAQDDSDKLPEYIVDDQIEALEIVSLAIESTEESIVDAANDGDSGVSEITKNTAIVVTGYFVISAIQRALSRIHGAAIARQAEDTQDAIDQAVNRGKTDAEFIATTEISKSYGEMVQEHFQSIGDNSYIWNTTFENSRQTHIANHLKEFTWDNPPSTGHPGDEPNCQCYVTRVENTNNISDRSMNAFNFYNEGNTLKIDIFGKIYEEAFDESEVGSINIIRQIEKSDANEIELSIYSRGGEAFAGSAIKSALQQHKAKVTANIYGLAASAATTIAAGADHITIGETDSFCIHNAWGMEIGDKYSMRHYADDLETLDKSIAFSWSKRSGKTIDEIHSLMDKDKFLTAQEAFDFGLVNEIRDDNGETKSCQGGFCAPQSALNKIPKEIVNRYKVRAMSHRIGQKNNSKTRQKSQSTNSEDAVFNQLTEEAKVNLEEAQAKISILQNEKAELQDQVTDLESNQVSDELREKMKNEIREDLIKERAEIDNVNNAIAGVGIEAKGDTANEIMRNALINENVEGAKDMADESVKSVFNFLIKTKKREADDDAANEAGNAISGDKSQHSLMNGWKVGEK